MVVEEQVPLDLILEDVATPESVLLSSPEW
jgi:hypothetical protein